MTDRLSKIYACLPPCEVFADVGCDHGYIAKAMLDGNKCKFAVISDVSEKCLAKAERLLCGYIAEGKAKSVVSDGFAKICRCDSALIAGMGGEEIISIIKNAPFLPGKLTVQPMKNSDKVRRAAVQAGYKIISDFTFKSAGKFYDLVSLERGEDRLTDEEEKYGRTNINSLPPAFVEKMRKRYELLNTCALNADEKAKKEMLCELKRIEKYVIRK